MNKNTNQNKSSVVNFGMEFVKEFATFLYQNEAIKFGDFILSSGKKSPYYIDLRIVPSYPHQFRKMIKALQNKIADEVGLDSYDSLVSVPTGGLVIASALAIETVKPLIYVRNKPKEYGTSSAVEGQVKEGSKTLMIDDVATTGGSIVGGIKTLKDAKIKVTDAYVILNRLEGAYKALEAEGVKLHHLTDVLEITNHLHQQGLVDDQTLQKVKDQIN